MRIFLTYVLPLLMPTVLFVLYVVIARRIMSGKGETAEALRRVPWLWLFAGGLVLLGIVLAIYALTSGEDAERPYVPPHMEDGRIVPGHVE